MDLSRYAALFLADGREHLRRANAELLAWEERPDRGASVDELFRAFHSLKGSAAAMNYPPVEAVAHSAESLLEGVRNRRLAPSKAVLGLLFQAVDLLDNGLEKVVRGEDLPDALPLAEAIGRLLESATPSVVAMEEPDRAPVAAPVAPPDRRAGRARVDPARLDELLQRAGELVVARNRLLEIAASRRDPELEAVASRLDTVTRGLHAGVLRVRLAPITELFGRLPRVVRDLAQSLGKTARLELKGEGIELDRSVLEELVDPLVHLLRNAVDHGIESAVERVAAGKQAEGRLTLLAEQRRDHIAIRLKDDGRGIDRARVARRAIERGLAAPGATLPGEELLAMLARPGFTMKDAVTAVSGRGVGIDAVLNRVRGLGGRLSLTTAVGTGSEFEIVVPLTTAVQRVLLVRANRQRFAVPLRLVREAAVTGRGAVAPGPSDGRISFRGRELSWIDLAAALGREPSVAPPTNRPVLMLEWENRSAVLGVDGLLGQQDVLLERIEAPADLPAWVTGATILGDGSPAFVLDPTALFRAEDARNG